MQNGIYYNVFKEIVYFRIVMLPTFNPEKVWNCFLSQGENPNENVNLFMGVPTMYVKLIDEYERTLTKTQRLVEFVKAACNVKIRYVFM